MTLIDVVSSSINNIKQRATDALKGVGEKLSTTAHTLVSAVSKAMKGVSDWIHNRVSASNTSSLNRVNTVGTALNSFTNTMTQDANRAVSGVISRADKVLHGATSTAENMLEDAKRIIENKTEATINHFSRLLENAIDRLKGYVNEGFYDVSTRVDSIKFELEDVIKSKLESLKEVFNPLSTMLAVGFIGLTNTLTNLFMIEPMDVAKATLEAQKAFIALAREGELK